MKFDSKIKEYFYKRFNDRNVKYYTSKKVYDIKAFPP